MENKICKNCNIEKNIIEFKNTGRLCRICFNEYMKERRSKDFQLNKKDKLNKKEYYEKNKDSYKKYYEKNKDIIKEHSKKWAIDNKDKYKNSQRKHSRKIKNIKSGYIYLITNPAWSEYVKLGYSNNTKIRLNTYQTCSPLKDFIICYQTYTNNVTLIENTFREKFGYDYGEWYKVNICEAINIIETLT